MTGLRIAVIGLGGMGLRHIAAIGKAGMEVGAVCDVNDQAVERAARESGTEPARYTNWSKCLEKEAGRTDVLAVATNGPSHAEITIAAARAGIPNILCEKPMSTSGQKAREMRDICVESSCRLAVNFPRRFMDRFIRLKSALHAGTIGKIYHVNIVAGAGGLGCIGAHWFDLCSWLLDTRPTWVVGSVDRNPAPNVRGPQFYDPGGRGLIGFDNDMTASVELSGGIGVLPVIQIIGAKGFVEFDQWSEPNGGRMQIFARPRKDWDVINTRFVKPELVDFDPGPAPDIVEATKMCLLDLVGDHREDTVRSGIDATDVVMAFHLSSQRDWGKVDLPLKGEDLLFDIPIT